MNEARRGGEAPRRLAYLSAAPMVSTRPAAALGGPQAHVLGVIQAFETLGWVVQRYIFGDRLKLGWAKRDNAKGLRSSSPMLFIADLARVFLGFLNGWKAARQLGDVDWAYERFASFQVLGRSLQRNRIPWILETNALMYVEAAADRRSIYLVSLARRIERRAYQDCDVLICVSQSLKEAILQEAVIDPDKILVVPNAVDVEFFDPARHEPVRLFSEPTIGFVGNLVRWQALDLLLRALSALRQEGIHYELVVVGDGPQREEWENLAESLGLGEHAKFTGRVPRMEVPGYMAGFDIGYSGQVPLNLGSMYLSPLKLYEYMAMARPVVAAAFDDARRLLDSTNAGYLYKAADAEDLGRALRRAYTERSLWAEMGRRARLEVAANHSWVARIDALLPEVKKILTRKYGTPFPARVEGSHYTDR